MREKPPGLRFRAQVITKLIRELLVRLVRWRLFRFEAIGAHNVPRTGGVVIAPNHLSFADPVAVWGSLKRPAVAVAMKELWKTPVGLLLTLLGHLPVDRTDRESGLRVFSQMRRVVDADGALLIFPEGKCSRDGELLPFRSGAAKLAFDARVPLIPVGVAGTNEVWPLGSRRIHRRKLIVVIYGSPLDPSEYPSINALNRALREEVLRLRREALALCGS